MAESVESDVFVSGGLADRGAARRLAELLRERGLSVFSNDDRLFDDKGSLHPVEDARQRSKAIAVLLSSTTDTTGPWLEEVEQAIDRAKDGKSLLIPVFLDNLSPSALPLGLRRFSGVFARTEDELLAGVAVIANAVQKRSNDRAATRVYGAVPPRPQGYFESSEVDRALSAVRAALAERDGPVWLTGLGGVGKSVVASEVCRRLSSEIDVVWWTTATSEESVVGGIASLSQALGLGHSGPGTLRDYAREALAFLARESVSWLLVLDDVEDETDILGWLPTSFSTGTCLITSRRQPSQRSRQVAVESWSSLEAVEYLRRLLPDVEVEGSSDHELREIANALGGHPLALALAAGYINRHGRTGPSQLHEFLRHLTSREQIYASQTVGESIEAALASVSVRYPVARDLLNAMGWLSSEPFPIEMFREASDDPFLSSTPSKISAAIDALNDHSLVSVDHDVCTAHDLIRAFARAISTDAIGFLLRLLAPAFSNPDSPDNWLLCTRLYPHVFELSRLMAGVEALHSDTQRESVELRVGTARYLMKAGSSEDALTLLRQTLSDSERIFGSDDLSTLNVRANLAGTYQNLGRHDEAAALLRQTIAETERILGRDHPSALSARANLAGILQSLGQHDEAAALLQQTIAKSERILGSDHPSTLSARANLAGIYQSLGRYDEAVALLQQTLVDSRRILGSDHPSTLTVQANLAFVVSHGHNA